MKTTTCFIAVFASVVLASASALPQEFICGGGDDNEAMTPPSIPAVGKLVFVHAPGGPDYYPVWAQQFADQLEAYLYYVSSGRVFFEFTTMARPGANSSKTWELPHPTSYYNCPGNQEPCFQTANYDMIWSVQNEWAGASPPNGTIWAGVAKIIIVYDSGACVFNDGPCPRGRGDIPLSSGPLPPQFVRNGCVMGLGSGELSATELSERVVGAAVHELGHTFAMGDVHGGGVCGAPPTFLVNLGRYDMMRSPGDGQPGGPGIPPYHPRWLINLGVPVQHFFPGPDQTVRIPNVRNRLGGVGTPGFVAGFYLSGNNGQAFLLANYDAQDPSLGNPPNPALYDGVFGGDGLLITHMWSTPPIAGEQIADIESASGKFTGASADPVNGKDSLEANWCFRGSGRDFFGRRPLAGETLPDVPRHFTGDSNPNTNVYVNSILSQPQCSDVEFRNIHRDTNGDMLVDVSWLRQPLLSPNGGQFLVRGQQVPVSWSVSQARQACIQSADVWLAVNKTTSLDPDPIPLLQGISNTGSTTVTIPLTQEFRIDYAIEVRTNLGVCVPIDRSDASMTIWGVNEPTIVAVVSYSCNSPTIKFDVSWQTSIATDVADVLEVFPPNQGTPFTQSAASLGTQHRVIWQGSCQANASVPWTYRVKSAKGTSVSTSALKSKLVTQCASCPPPCHPPCELE